MWPTFSRRSRSPSLPGDMAIGHTRYSTAGDTVLLNAQPFSVACNKGQIAVAHNGNITNAGELRRDLEREGSIFQASSDTEVILHLVARSRERTLAGALREALLQLEGAFSLVFLAKDRVIVARDPHGFRPLAFGRMPSAAEGGTRLRIRVGNLRVRFDQRRLCERCGAGRDGLRRSGRLDARALGARSAASALRLRARLFLAARFHRVRTLGAGSRVRIWGDCWRANRLWPPTLWFPCRTQASPPPSDFASESNIPFRQALIRNHYVGRTFIEPSQAIRDFGVKLKLNPVRHQLEGKRVILVDDSIVRGTTSRKIVRMVRNAGAREVHLRISCPPTISPCFYGVDTPCESELIAANNSIEEIRQFVEADSLAYLSLDSLRKAVADTKDEYCYACYTGNYPTELVQIEELVAARSRRYRTSRSKSTIKTWAQPRRW